MALLGPAEPEVMDEGGPTNILEGDLPLSLRLCGMARVNDTLAWLTLALAIPVLPTSLVLIARAFKSNVNWPAIIFLIYSYNVWMIILQTIGRTILIIWAYSWQAEQSTIDAVVNSMWDLMEA